MVTRLFFIVQAYTSSELIHVIFILLRLTPREPARCLRSIFASENATRPACAGLIRGNFFALRLIKKAQKQNRAATLLSFADSLDGVKDALARRFESARRIAPILRGRSP